MTIALLNYYSKNLAYSNFFRWKTDKRKALIKSLNLKKNEKTFYECLKIYRMQEVEKFLAKNNNKEDLKFIHSELKFHLSEINKWNYYILGVMGLTIFAIYDKIFVLDFLSKDFLTLPMVFVIVVLFSLIYTIGLLYFITAIVVKEIVFSKESQKLQLIDILEDLILKSK